MDINQNIKINSHLSVHITTTETDTITARLIHNTSEIGATSYLNVFEGNENQAIRRGIMLLRKGVNMTIDQYRDISEQLGAYLDKYASPGKGSFQDLSQENLDRLYELIELVRRDLLSDSKPEPRFLLQRNADNFLFEHVPFSRGDIDTIYRNKPNKPDTSGLKD